MRKRRDVLRVHALPRGVRSGAHVRLCALPLLLRLPVGEWQRTQLRMPRALAGTTMHDSIASRHPVVTAATIT